jgi:hypothetical protein
MAVKFVLYPLLEGYNLVLSGAYCWGDYMDLREKKWQEYK